MSNICKICKSDLINLHNLEHHRQFCGTLNIYKAVKTYLKEKCTKCDLEFNSFPELSVISLHVENLCVSSVEYHFWMNKVCSGILSHYTMDIHLLSVLEPRIKL